MRHSQAIPNLASDWLNSTRFPFKLADVEGRFLLSQAPKLSRPDSHQYVDALGVQISAYVRFVVSVHLQDELRVQNRRFRIEGPAGSETEEAGPEGEPEQIRQGEFHKKMPIWGSKSRGDATNVTRTVRSGQEAFHRQVRVRYWGDREFGK